MDRRVVRDDNGLSRFRTVFKSSADLERVPLVDKAYAWKIPGQCWEEWEIFSFTRPCKISSSTFAAAFSFDGLVVR